MNAAPPQSGLPLTLATLATVPRWVAWQTAERDPGGKPTKVPYAPRTGHKALADDPTTWGTRPAAEARAAGLPKPHGSGGVGIELGDLGDGRCLGGVDLDTCRETDGTLAPWAVEVIDALGSYAEVSPSGGGMKVFFIFAAADLPAIRAAMGTDHGKMWKRPGSRAHPPAIELHTGNRYFAVTDQHLDGTPTDLRPVTLDALLWLIRDAGPTFADAGKASGDGTGYDNSRSAIAFRKGGALRRAGLTYEAMAAALRADPETSDWATENGVRGLRRIWDKSAPSAAPIIPPGVPTLSILTRSAAPPPALPINAFGPLWADWIAHAAEGANAPPDYVALPLLAAASALIGNAIWAKAWHGWAEPPVLWCGSVGNPSSGKSPGAAPVLSGVMRIVEARMSRDYPEAIERWNMAAEIARAVLKNWESAVAKAVKNDREIPEKPDAALDRVDIQRVQMNALMMDSMDMNALGVCS